MMIRISIEWLYFCGGLCIGSTPLIFVKYGWIGLIPAAADVLFMIVIITVSRVERRLARERLRKGIQL
jgi:CHASE2 domain-containing sensor protein